MNDKTVVFVVDDESDNIELMTRALSKTYAVRGFTDPREVAAAAKKTPPACVIVDYRMPNKNGIELLRELRDAGVACAQLIVTGFASEADVLAAEKDRLVFQVVPKPCRPADLLLQVELAIKVSRISRRTAKPRG